jgi:hypothetical protein
LVDYYRETEKTIEKAKKDYQRKKVPERVLTETESRERTGEGAIRYPIFDDVLRAYTQFQGDLKGFWRICQLLEDDSGGINYILDDWNTAFRGEKGEKIAHGATDDEDDDIESDTESEQDNAEKEKEEEAAVSSSVATSDEPPIKREKIESLTEEDRPASQPN